MEAQGVGVNDGVVAAVTLFAVGIVGAELAVIREEVGMLFSRPRTGTEVIQVHFDVS